MTQPRAVAITALDALAAAVLTAYGFNAKKDLLAQLLALNQDVAEKIMVRQSRQGWSRPE